MTENNLEPRVSRLEKKVSNFETKLDMFIDEMRDFKTEMRDRDNRRAAEISELRQKQETDIKEIRSSIEKMNDKIDGMGQHVRNLTVATIGAVGAISVAVVGLIITIILK